MQIAFGTALVVIALASSILLLMQMTDRMLPTVAAIAAGIEALLVFGLMSLSLAKFRIDVILPAVLVVAGGICWGKVSTKHTVTAATLVTVVGALQLLLALRVFH